MNTVITRFEVKQRLEDWRAGRLSTDEMHRWAEAGYAVDGYETEDSVVNEVLANLDTLDMNLLIPADVPALLELLRAQPEILAAGLAEFESYWSRIDMSQRRAALRGDPIYAAFCDAG